MYNTLAILSLCIDMYSFYIIVLIPRYVCIILSNKIIFINFIFQIVWADTTHVGCGITQCDSGELGVAGFPSGLTADLVFCTYGPA